MKPSSSPPSFFDRLGAVLFWIFGPLVVIFLLMAIVFNFADPTP